MAQIVLGIITFVVLAVFTAILYFKRRGERPDLERYNTVTMDRLLHTVKVQLAEVVKDDDRVLAGDIDFEAIVRNKRRIEKALTDCVYAIESARAIVIGLIRSILEVEIPDMETACILYDFTAPRFLDSMVKWEILLYKLSKTYNNDVIRYLEETYSISNERIVYDGTRNEHVPRRIFDYRYLDEIFDAEVDEITYSEALDIIAILLYQRYKGMGCIDTLYLQNIDGMNCGASGSVRFQIEGKFDIPYKATNSVWVQINAKWVHFSFLDFYKEGEMKRIINQLTSYGVTSPMTEKNPAKVTESPTGSRITALRKPAAEWWAVFIRKFVLSVYSMDFLVNKPFVKNAELPMKLIYFLMQAEETTAFTGQQNTGKTTMMKAAIEYIKRCNIRVLEMSFELALREIYTDWNIETVKPTDYISSSQLQDLLKKTDAYMSLVGEVAEDIVAARMIQFCLIASAFTIFSHHGKDDPGLINGLGNSLVACGEYEDHNVAVSTVLDAIKNNVHLQFVDNERTIEYISEIIKLDEVAEYPKLKQSTTIEEAIDQLSKVQREYATRVTDRERFKSRKIIVFDRKTKTYYPNYWYTPETMARIMRKLDDKNRAEFVAFYKKWWVNAPIAEKEVEYTSDPDYPAYIA